MARCLPLLLIAAALAACARTHPVTISHPASAGTVTSGDVLFEYTPGQPRVDAVYLTGDFTGWHPTAIPMRDPEGDGTWTITRAFEPGLYRYQFVTYAARWFSDPASMSPESLMSQSDVRELAVAGIRGW